MIKDVNDEWHDALFMKEVYTKITSANKSEKMIQRRKKDLVTNFSDKEEKALVTEEEFLAPRKKNKIIDECETSAAANKRMRMDILNRTNGVPFTSRFNQFPSIYMLQQQRNPTQNIGSDLRLAPPSPVRPEEVVADDGFISTLIPQQNFIINYHMN
ncbi:hypothetical protein Hanom_Chr01g00091661 [Helianthus anomalus]